MYVALLCCSALSATAQSNEQIKNKKGTDIMPVKGEWAIGAGIGVRNLTSWIGNMLGFTSSNNSFDNTYINHPVFGSSVSIFGKYMLADNQALRISFSNSGSDVSTRYKVNDDRENDPEAFVIDKLRQNVSETYVSVGMDWRRGKTRLRGVYGGELVLSWKNQHDHYTYGNALGESNLTPTSQFNIWTLDGRLKEERYGATFGVGARGFVGAEYFIAPKICIGTEFGYTLSFETTGKSKMRYERYDPFVVGGGDIVTHTNETEGSRTFSSGIDNFNTQFYFHFYF